MNLTTLLKNKFYDKLLNLSCEQKLKNITALSKTGSTDPFLKHDVSLKEI